MYDISLLKSNRTVCGAFNYLLLSIIMLLGYYFLSLATVPDTTGMYTTKINENSFFRVSEYQITPELSVEFLKNTVASIIETEFDSSPYVILCENDQCEIRVYEITSKQAFNIVHRLHQEI